MGSTSAPATPVPTCLPIPSPEFPETGRGRGEVRAPTIDKLTCTKVRPSVAPPACKAPAKGGQVKSGAAIPWSAFPRATTARAPETDGDPRRDPDRAVRKPVEALARRSTGPPACKTQSTGGEMGGASAATWPPWLPAAAPTPPETSGGPRDGAPGVGRERPTSPMGCRSAGIPGRNVEPSKNSG